MKITYTARKVNLKDNFKDKAEKKLGKFDRIFSDTASANITVTVEKNRQTVEVTINDNGMIYRAENTCAEMNEALDKVIDVLGRQIRKNKAKLGKRLRTGLIDEAFVGGEEPVEEENEMSYEIIRTKVVNLKPMTVEEAILRMNMVNHKFFMFLNAETDEISVVYSRDNGAFGLLQSELS